MVNFLVVGCCIRSFGIFFELVQERYRASAAEIAWIPAIVGSVPLFSGTVNQRPLITVTTVTVVQIALR